MDNAPIPVFAEEELYEFIGQISRERHISTIQANTHFARDFVYSCTKGVINKTTTQAVIDKILDEYSSVSSRRKALGFFKRYLNYLNDTKDGVNLTPFIRQIELVKLIKTKQINVDIIVDDDVKNLINHIEEGRNNIKNPDNAIALVYFLAYNGMRQATCDRLTVRHIKDALSLSQNPCIHVEADIDKTRTEHYVPLHPKLKLILNELIKGKDDNDTIFDSEKLTTYLKNHRLYQTNIPTKYVFVKHLRKYFIQKSTKIGLKDDFRDYIVSNQVNSIQWLHYKNFTPEDIYNEYMRVWGPVKFVDEEELPTTPEIPLDPEIEYQRLRYLRKEIEAMEPVDPEENWEQIEQMVREDQERRERIDYKIQEMKGDLEELLMDKKTWIKKLDEVLTDDEYFNKRLNKAEIPKKPLEPEIIIERLQYLIKEIIPLDPDLHDGKMWDFFQIQKQNEEDYKNYLINYKIPQMKEQLEELAADKFTNLGDLDELLKDEGYFEEKMKKNR